MLAWQLRTLQRQASWEKGREGHVKALEGALLAWELSSLLTVLQRRWDEERAYRVIQRFFSEIASRVSKRRLVGAATCCRERRIAKAVLERLRLAAAVADMKEDLSVAILERRLLRVEAQVMEAWRWGRIAMRVETRCANNMQLPLGVASSTELMRNHLLKNIPSRSASAASERVTFRDSRRWSRNIKCKILHAMVRQVAVNVGSRELRESRRGAVLQACFTHLAFAKVQRTARMQRRKVRNPT